MRLQYKCPKCSARMNFDASGAVLHCGSCRHEETVTDYQKQFNTPPVSRQQAVYDDEEARQYLCKKCGGIIVTDNHSAITSCPFCGGQAALGERIAGDLAPSGVIPFSVSAKTAEKQYKKWKRRLLLAPKELSKTQKSKKLIPIYIPYWLYHLECHGEARFHAVTTSTIMEETQDKAVETRHYELYRQGQICLPEYPICASGKIDERLTAQLPSYDFKEKQPFQIQHLSGCLSEKYHSSDQDLQPNAENAAKTEMDRFLMSALTGYDSVSVKERDYHVTVCSAEYILCPAWLAFCDTADPDYMFLLNAQNGKPASQPPISGIKAGAVIFLVAVFAFILFRILTVVLGGPLL